jgi:hypothetical protein
LYAKILKPIRIAKKATEKIRGSIEERDSDREESHKRDSNVA